MKKNSCTPINPKKYSCCGLKKIHIRNLITKKNSCGSKIPLLHPHNFSNGPSLTSVDIVYVIESAAYGVIFTSCLGYSFPSSPPFAKGKFGGGAAKKQPFECKR